MTGIETSAARRIIEIVGSSGQPPEWGLQYFTAGLDDVLRVLKDEYLRTYIRDGGASFKMVIGAFGGGKTHCLYCIRELAWRNNYLVSYCPLGPEESPFYQLDRIYKAIVDNLMLPLGPEGLTGRVERGIDVLLREYFRRTLDTVEANPSKTKSPMERFEETLEEGLKGAENINFVRAIEEALRALYEERKTDYRNILQWLSVSGYDRRTHRDYGILEPIRRGNAFSMIRSLTQWIQNLHYNGIVILFDEAEQVPSLTSKQKDLLLSNLREIIDQCGHANFPGVMIFYAIPSEALFEGKSAVYEALKQRIATVFDLYNPSGVKIYLDHLDIDPADLLMDIGDKLFDIYSISYRTNVPRPVIRDADRLLAEAALEERFGDIGYKRLFVQAAIQAYHLLRQQPNIKVDHEWASRLIRGNNLA